MAYVCGKDSIQPPRLPPQKSLRTFLKKNKKWYNVSRKTSLTEGSKDHGFSNKASGTGFNA